MQVVCGWGGNSGAELEKCRIGGQCLKCNFEASAKGGMGSGRHMRHFFSKSDLVSHGL